MTDEEKIRAAYEDMTTRRHNIRGYGGRIFWAVPPQLTFSAAYDHDAICEFNMDVVRFDLRDQMVFGTINETTVRVF